MFAVYNLRVLILMHSISKLGPPGLRLQHWAYLSFCGKIMIKANKSSSQLLKVMFDLPS